VKFITTETQRHRGHRGHREIFYVGYAVGVTSS
jgi:hypothetical protein